MKALLVLVGCMIAGCSGSGSETTDETDTHAVATSGLYADSSCTQPVVASDERPAYLRDGDRLYATGAQYLGRIYSLEPNGCEAVTTTLLEARTSSVRYYRLGPATN